MRARIAGVGASCWRSQAAHRRRRALHRAAASSPRACSGAGGRDRDQRQIPDEGERAHGTTAPLRGSPPRCAPSSSSRRSAADPPRRGHRRRSPCWQRRGPRGPRACRRAGRAARGAHRGEQPQRRPRARCAPRCARRGAARAALRRRARIHLRRCGAPLHRDEAAGSSTTDPRQPRCERSPSHEHGRRVQRNTIRATARQAKLPLQRRRRRRSRRTSSTEVGERCGEVPLQARERAVAVGERAEWSGGCRWRRRTSPRRGGGEGDARPPASRIDVISLTSTRRRDRCGEHRRQEATRPEARQVEGPIISRAPRSPSSGRPSAHAHSRRTATFRAVALARSPGGGRTR